ncbi:MAG: UDP-N-acetylmuramoyl-tripeptide--D-alanyl-D-alanine ligase [Oscillospiraceae bacterium]|nr:UDP-N-acetylmuramoyl-tripeptide--D-alanyl-D-alanine ligase [Oscillospiraceae bacterium]
MIIYILAAVYLILSSIASLTCVHMLQLSSYQTPSYWAWFKRGGWQYYTRFGFPRKAKKPLKYTPRVIRILFTQFIFLAALGYTVVITEYYLILIAYWFAVPFIVMLSNFITMPIQKMINNGFIKDAKKILKSNTDLKIIGITGSYGKTSMKVILTRLLSVKYETLMTPDSYNTPMGVVRTIRERLKPSHEVFVCEMGARHVGDIKEICDIVKPQTGILTSIGEQHLDTFKTLENIIKTKFELIDARTGTAFLNVDSNPVREHPRPDNCITYGIDNPADYTAKNLSATSKGLSFTVHAPGGETAKFTTSLLGRHNILNIVGAISVAHNMGVSLSRLTEPVALLPQIKHRLEIVKGEYFTIIDDAYNANPAGVAAALDALNMFEGVKVVITPGMVELGERQDELNREYGKQLAAVADHVFLVGERQTKPIAEGLGAAAFTVCASFNEAMEKAKIFGADVVLLANDLPDNY